MAYHLRALTGSGNGRLCLAPRPGQRLCQRGYRRGCPFRRYALGGIEPRPPPGLPATARTALLVPASAASLPSAPEGLPKTQALCRQLRLFYHVPTGSKVAIADFRLRKVSDDNRPKTALRSYLRMFGQER